MLKNYLGRLMLAGCLLAVACGNKPQPTPADSVNAVVQPSSRPRTAPPAPATALVAASQVDSDSIHFVISWSLVSDANGAAQNYDVRVILKNAGTTVFEGNLKNPPQTVVVGRPVVGSSADTLMVEIYSVRRGLRSPVPARASAVVPARTDVPPPPPDTVVIDTLPTPPDTTPVPPDTTPVPPDTTPVPPDTTPPDTTIGAVPQPDPSGYAELPRRWIDTRMPEAVRTLSVTSCGSLQATLDSAQAGDRIALSARLRCRGAFVARDKLGTVILTTETQLPAEGTRVTPSTAANYAVLVAPGVEPALRILGDHWRVVGITIQMDSTASLNYGMLRVGTGGESVLEDIPADVVLDRIYMTTPDSADVQRCIAMEVREATPGTGGALIDSWISGCHFKGQDAQALVSWNSPGPFKVVNNRLEGSGENVMWGGADPRIDSMVAADIEFRRNHVIKPDSWYDRNGTNPYTEKNLFELKNSRRVLIEENVFEGNWQDGQTGFGIVLKSSNQSGRCTWCVTEHVTMRHNWLKDSPGGTSFHRLDDYSHTGGIPMNHIVFVDNLHTGILRYAGARRTFQITGARVLYIARNTMVESGSSTAISMDGAPSDSTQIIGNLLDRGNYGVHGSNKGEGTAAILYYLPEGKFEGNAIIGAPARLYPEGNYFPASAAEAPANVGVDQVDLFSRLTGVVVE